jgi:hypothetical protein
MNLLFTAIMFLLAIPPQDPAPTTFRIRGKVTGVPAAAPAGLFRATLMPLFPSPTGAVHVGIQSDGTFTFQVRPGRYNLTTVPFSGGSRQIEVADRDIDVPDARLQFALWGQAVMDDGSSIPARQNSTNPATYVFMRTRVVSGPPRIDLSGFATVAPNGMFTFDLPAGEFAIGTLQLPMGYTVKSMTLGSIDLLKASTFQIPDPTMANEVRMVLTAKVPEGATWKKISGRVEGFVPGTSSLVGIEPATPFRNFQAGTILEQRMGEARVRPDGTFEIANVPKGEYTLQYRPNPTGGRVLWGPMIRVTVGDADLTGVGLPAAP